MTLNELFIKLDNKESLEEFTNEIREVLSCNEYDELKVDNTIEWITNEEAFSSPDNFHFDYVDSLYSILRTYLSIKN
jgi:hypothetical protein